MPNSSGGLYTFGSYRLDAASRVLTRSGVMVTLAPKTFDLLVLMAGSGGRLLSKRELMDALWNGTFVEEANLSFQMSSLRKALGEEGNSWIEAVPKCGYRFKAPVERSAATADAHSDVVPAPSVEPAVPRTPSRKSRAWFIGAVAAALVVAAVVSLAIWNGKRRSGATLRVAPATTYPGRETGPNFSPDGSQIAFAWDGEKGNNFDIYVKLVGENRALRLTSDPRPEFSPVWSPDGRRIAFCRVGEDANEIALIPALGGRERVVARLPKHIQAGNPGQPLTWFPGNEDASEQLLAWFPDGEFLAVVGRKVQGGPNVIFLLSVTTGEMQQLTFPPDRSWGDGSPSVSPDGHRLAFTRSLKQYPTPAHVYVAPLTDRKSAAGEPECLTTNESDSDAGLAWASDARRLVFPSERGLWVVALNHKIPEALIVPGYNPTYPAISAKGDRLAFVQSSVDLDIWRIGGPALARRGSADALSPPAKLISSTLMDTNPQYSPDGLLIAFTSSRTGMLQIWVCDNDGSNPVQLTNFDVETGAPRWSPDGRYIVFDSIKAGSGDIYMVPAQGGAIRRFTKENSHEDMASWSRDGKWIYFESDRSGNFEIWKTPFAGGTAVQVTNHGGADAFESPDGKFVYYAKWEQRGIWRKPTNGGPETLIIDRGSPYHWGLFDEGICLVDSNAETGPIINCTDFEGKRVRPVARLPKNTRINEIGPSFSVSRDGRRILYVGVEREESDLMMVDNFR